MSGAPGAAAGNSSGSMRRVPSVTFVEPPRDEAPQPARLRYSQLFKSMTGGSFISGGGISEQEINRHAFDSSALPAKPAMKRLTSSSNQNPYPAVTNTAGGTALELVQSNPATGLAYQTTGGAALASALGAMAIPPSCPPALPPTAVVSVGAVTSSPPRPIVSSMVGIPNPLAVSDMPIGAGVAHTDANATDRHGSTTMPLVTLNAADSDSPRNSYLGSSGTHTLSDDDVALLPGAASHMYGPPATVSFRPAGNSSPNGTAHVTVQLAPGNASIDGIKEPLFADHTLSDVHASHDQYGGDETWQHISRGDHSTDVNAAAAAAGGTGGAHAFDDDGASSCAIIPPGHQEPIPPFWGQLTFRAVLVGLLVGFGFVLLNMRLALVTGVTPNLQVVMAGGCWALLRIYTGILGRDMTCIPPLSSQEVTVAASAALAVSSSAAAGGFGTVLLAMQEPLIQRVGATIPANLPSLFWSVGYWKLVAYLLMVGLAGALLMLPFRKMLFARPSMTFATGAAAGQLVNTLHTPAMSYHGHKQMNRFAQWSVISFLFSGYQWVFNNPSCNGFTRFPTFGLQALKYTWNFDFQLPFVGLGILAPISVTWSMLVGALLSWGLLWPVLSSKEGVWFPAKLRPWDIHGVFGYQLTVAMALLLSDAAYHVVKGMVGTLRVYSNCRNEGTEADHNSSSAVSRAGALEELEATAEAAATGPMRKRLRRSKGSWRQEALRIIETDTLSDASSLQFSMAAMERALRQHIFMADGVRGWVGILCFVVLTVAAVFALPSIFNLSAAGVTGGAAEVATGAASRLRMHHVLVAGALSVVVALANARGAGVTDLNMADMYARFGMLAFAAWAGPGMASAGTGLVCGGLLLGVATSAVNAMYAWRAGFMTMSSPTAVFVSHMIGLGAGCFLAPAAWLMFDSAAMLGGGSTSSLVANDGYFASPVAAIFRSTSVLASSGMSALPMHTPWFALSALVVGLGLNALRDMLPMAMRGVVPIPAAVGVVCLSGAAVAVDLAVGAAARVFWRLRYPRSADAYALVVGCALIAGEGLWGLGKALLGAFGVQAPICMTFSMA